MKVTEEAIGKAYQLRENESNDSLKLRVAVQPGGCSGLRYQLFFDDRTLEGDEEQTLKDGFVLVVDRMSAPYLTNATLHYVDELNKSGFSIDNPDAHGSCACGESFY